jgi:hypothetical protein
MSFVLLVTEIGDAQRNFFGESSANSLFYAATGAAAVAFAVVILWRAGKRRLSASVGFLGLALVLAFLGWFVHPDQVHARALSRVTDWEDALGRYKAEQTLILSDPDANIRYQRFAQELAARRCEYQAAKIRYRGDPAFFRSGFETWCLWALALCCALVSLVSGVSGTRFRGRHIFLGASE